MEKVIIKLIISIKLKKRYIILMKKIILMKEKK